MVEAADLGQLDDLAHAGRLGGPWLGSVLLGLENINDFDRDEILATDRARFPIEWSLGGVADEEFRLCLRQNLPIPHLPRSEVLAYMAKSPHTSRSLSDLHMGTKNDDTFRRQARILKALANESRLKIVERLSRGECSVGKLTDLVGSDRSTISKHLAVLRAHDIVLDRREGNVVYYTLLIPCVMNFFSCATQVLNKRA
jgi:ArsR family transcriptional regulator